MALCYCQRFILNVILGKTYLLAVHQTHGKMNVSKQLRDHVRGLGIRSSHAWQGHGPVQTLHRA